MGPRHRQQLADGALAVAATIVHVGSGRVLALQRFDEDRWVLPGGPVARGEDLEVRLRAYVRAATGFEIRRLVPTGRCATATGTVAFVRCEISGVGADITSRTRTMQWMDRAAIRAFMDPVSAVGMLTALDTASASGGAETLLAS